MSKNNGWISFRECRPCDSGYYLVFTEYDKTIQIEFYDADLCECGAWLEHTDDGIKCWQPLPEPPQF